MRIRRATLAVTRSSRSAAAVAGMHEQVQIPIPTHSGLGHLLEKTW